MAAGYGRFFCCCTGEEPEDLLLCSDAIGSVIEEPRARGFSPTSPRFAD
jgi:hypothetical protein